MMQNKLSYSKHPRPLRDLRCHRKHKNKFDCYTMRIAAE